jgi:hypothetical protein
MNKDHWKESTASFFSEILVHRTLLNLSETIAVRWVLHALSKYVIGLINKGMYLRRTLRYTSEQTFFFSFFFGIFCNHLRFKYKGELRYVLKPWLAGRWDSTHRENMQIFMETIERKKAFLQYWNVNWCLLPSSRARVTGIQLIFHFLDLLLILRTWNREKQTEEMTP